MKKLSIALLSLLVTACSSYTFAADALESPRLNLTPGAVNSAMTASKLCDKKLPDEVPPPSVVAAAIAEYNVTNPTTTYGVNTKDWVVDCLVPTKLGGNCKVLDNVWVQSTTVAFYTAKRKDELENKLYEEMCRKLTPIPLTTIVPAVRDNWRSAYVVHVNSSFPTPANTTTPTNTPTATNTPTNTATNTPTDTPTNTATNTPTDTPTGTPTDTPTNTPTNVPT